MTCIRLERVLKLANSTILMLLNGIGGISGYGVVYASESLWDELRLGAGILHFHLAILGPM